MSSQHDPLLPRLRRALEALPADVEHALAELRPAYDPHVRFQDPLQAFEGRERFMAMNRKLVEHTRELRFDITDAVETADSIFLAWTMVVRPKVGPRMVIPGTSHLRLRGGLIVEHRDYWDLLSGVMDAVPLAGPIYRALAAKMV
jgi:hypothetical protein